MTRMQVMHLEKISIFATYDSELRRIAVEHWDIVDFCSFKKSIHVRENGFEHDIANARGHNHLLNNFRLISA